MQDTSTLRLHPRIRLPGHFRESARNQYSNNMDALADRLSSAATRESYDLKVGEDIATIVYEVGLSIPTDVLVKAFQLSAQELQQLQAKEPIALYDCLNCKAPLPDDNRNISLRREHALRSICNLNSGQIIEVKSVSDLLCDICTHKLSKWLALTVLS